MGGKKLPRNYRKLVSQERKCTNCSLIVTCKVKKPFPTPCSVQVALSLYCDLCTLHRCLWAGVEVINAIPCLLQLCFRACCKRLAPFVRDEADSAALQTLLQDREAGVGLFRVCCWCAPAIHPPESTIDPTACGPDGFSEDLHRLQLFWSLEGFPDSCRWPDEYARLF